MFQLESILEEDRSWMRFW